MSENAKKFVARAGELITLPEVYVRVKRVLEDSRSGAADMAAAIETDAATTARLLRVANSPFFGFAARIDAVPRAVSMLGTVHIHDLVLATSITSSFAGITSEVLDIRAFWRDSLARAIAAKLLANHCNVLDGDRLFVAGLLCHIGEMLLALNDPEMASRAEASALNRHLPLAEVQRELLGFDYAMLGAELLAAWHLPASLEDIVRHHLDPTDAVRYPLETAIVHIACQLAGSADDAALAQVADSAQKYLELDSAALGDLRTTLESQIAAVEALFFPLRKSA